MDGILDIEFKGSGDSLESAPERFTCVFYDMIMSKSREQLFDLVVEDILEDVNCIFDAVCVTSL